MSCWQLILDAITALSTLALFWVAWIQLGAMRQISRADFVHRLNNDLYRPNAITLFGLLDKDDVRFSGQAEHAEFVDSSGRVLFNRHELNDLILGPLENVGTFQRDGIISLKTAYDVCGSYVLKIWRKPFIKEYVQWCRRNPEDADTFECLEALYKEFKAFNEDKLGLRSSDDLSPR